MIAAVALWLQSAPPGAAPAKEPDIVVVGRPLEETGAKLAACVARHCPVPEDVKASLDHAENLFVHGDYDQAKHALSAAIERDRKAAGEHPVLIAGLYRASARLSAHQGDEDRYRLDLIKAVETLRAGLPRNDQRVLAARIEVADVFAEEGRYVAAASFYRGIAADAGQSAPAARGYAMLRTASLYQQLAAFSPSLFGEDARHAMNDLLATSDPALQPFRDAARILQARAAIKAGDTQAFDQLVAQLHRTEGETPLLVSRPPIKPDGDTTFYPDQWVDISYWVRPDGSVADVEVLRRSPALREGWLPPVIDAIKASRYVPMARDANDPGVYRVERYSRVASMAVQQAGGAASRIMARTGDTRIEMLDLTATPGKR